MKYIDIVNSTVDATVQTNSDLNAKAFELYILQKEIEVAKVRQAVHVEKAKAVINIPQLITLVNQQLLLKLEIELANRLTDELF